VFFPCFPSKSGSFGQKNSIYIVAVCCKKHALHIYEKRSMVMNKKKWHRFLEHFGKLLLDLAKLSFGSLVLGTIIKGEIEHSTLLLVGSFVSLAVAALGLSLVTVNEE
jgi:hypothetical protein